MSHYIIKHSIYSNTLFPTNQILFKYQIITTSDDDYKDLNSMSEEKKIETLLKKLEQDVQTYLNNNLSMEPHEGLVMVDLKGNKKRFYQALKEKNNYETAMHNSHSSGNYIIELLLLNNELEAETITEHNYQEYEPIGNLISINEDNFIAQAFYQEPSMVGGKKIKKTRKKQKTRKKN